MAEALAADPDELERMGRAGAADAARLHRADAEAEAMARLFGARPGRPPPPTPTPSP